MNHWLSVALFAPLAGMAVLLAIPSRQQTWIKAWANIAAFLSLLATIPLALAFDPASEYFLTQKVQWIPSIGASYSLGLDGLSLLMVLLTALIGFLAVLSSWSSITTRVKEYYAWMLLQQTAMLGVFLAQDFFLFFVFWEASLIPMYFLIAIWGGERRAYAATKFLIYTVVGSVLMLLGGLALYQAHLAQFTTPSFAIADLMRVTLGWEAQLWIFAAFFAGWAVKVPMWPFHTWLPDAHTEAPTAGSVILASILLKMGTYGFLRFSLPLVPDAARDPRVVEAMGALSLIAILYGALASLMQKDWKRLVAYSSVSHLGFCTLGMFALNPLGLKGSIIQQINHGISTGLLFLIVGAVYDRRHTRAIADFGGLYRVMPMLTIVFAISALSSMGMPPLNGFIGEITILQGVFAHSTLWAVGAAIGILLGVAYLLWLFQRTMLGAVSEANATLRDLSPREIAVLAPLLLLAVGIGLYPKPLFDVLDRPVARILERAAPTASSVPGPAR
jgi:NADH-quinone oxidoreductase subunit M